MGDRLRTIFGISPNKMLIMSHDNEINCCVIGRAYSIFENCKLLWLKKGAHGALTCPNKNKLILIN